MLFRVFRKITIEERMVNELDRAIRKASKRTIPAAERRALAERSVKRMDFNDPFQMQCSLESYADNLVLDYKRKLRCATPR